MDKQTKILGISKFSVIEFQGKFIIFLGERHIKKIIPGVEYGIEVYKWMYNVINASIESNKKINFYLEDYVNQQYKFEIEDNIDKFYNNDNNTDYLPNIRCLFNLLSKNVENELIFKFKQIDARHIIINNFNMIKTPFATFALNLDIIETLDQSCEFGDIPDNKLMIFQYFTGYKINELTKHTFNIFISLLETDCKFKMEYTEEYLILFHPLILNLFDSMPVTFNKDKFFTSLYEQYNSELIAIDLLNISMDIYFLLNFLHDSIETSLIYSGSTHINLYLKFFESYLNILPLINKDSIDDYINI